MAGELVELGAGLGALVFELGEAGADAVAHGAGGRGGGVEGLQFPDESILAGLDAVQGLAQRGGFLVAAGGLVGGGGGELVGEQGGAFGAEDPLVEELGDGGDEVVFAEGDGAGVVGAAAAWRALSMSCGHM